MIRECSEGILPQALIEFFSQLATRIASAEPPHWPLPIFEAESYLYAYFLENMLTVLDTLRTQGKSNQEIASLFITPSRVSELGYILIGMQFSKLSKHNRKRLASHLVSCVSAFRPDDPFLKLGGNRPLVPRLSSEELLKQSMHQLCTNEQQLARLRGALLSLAEIICIGIPQYGREVMGPYRFGSSSSFLVRKYFNLAQSQYLGSDTTLDFGTLELVEVYDSLGPSCIFDITNHMQILADAESSRIGTIILVEKGEVVALDATEAERTVMAVLHNVLKSIRSFDREQWLRLHIEARYGVLWPLFDAAGIPRVSIEVDLQQIGSGCSYYDATQRILSSTKEEITAFLCSECGVS